MVGKPISRPDGPAKVLGSATYAAEYNVPNLWYGYVVSSPIAKGKITKIDAAEVLALPGVQQVFSHENVLSLAWFDRAYKDDVAPYGLPFRPLHAPEIMFNHQPVALVIAETFELARYAASILRIEYEANTDFNTDLDKARPQAFDAPKGKTGFYPPLNPRATRRSLLRPLGVKGVGEIGMLGVTAAVANAVYHATGKRVRDLPLTIDKLL